MATVTAPIMTDATGQSIDSKLNSLLVKMDNLAAAFQPNASGIVYSNTTSGLTGDDVQEAIDEMAADVSEIKQSLSDLTEVVKDYRTTPIGYNGGGRIFIQKMGNTCIIRFVDYIPKSPTGLQLLTDLPFNMKTDNSNIIFNSSSGQYKILLSSNKIYSYYNADMSANTNLFNGQVIGFIVI